MASYHTQGLPSGIQTHRVVYQAPSQYQLQSPRYSPIRNYPPKEGIQGLPRQRINPQNLIRHNPVRIQNRGGHNVSFGINRDIRVNNSRGISTEFQPINNALQDFSPQPRVLHRQIINPNPQSNRYQPISPDYPYLQTFTFRPQQVYDQPFQQYTELSKFEEVNPSLEESQIFCVICEEFYNLNQREDHKQKHIRADHQSSKIPDLLSTSQPFKNQVISRPIVQPEEYNIRYLPNKYILEHETNYLTQQRRVAENGTGTHQLTNFEIETTPQMILSPRNNCEAVKVSLDQSRYSNICQEPTHKADYFTRRSMGKKDGWKIENADNQRILRDSYAPDQTSFAEQPRNSRNRQTLLVYKQQDLNLPLSDKKMSTQDANQEYDDQQESLPHLPKILYSHTQRLQLESDHQSLSRQVHYISGKYNAISNRKMNEITSSFKKPLSSSKIQRQASQKMNSSQSKSNSSTPKIVNYVYKRPQKLPNSSIKNSSSARRTKRNVTQSNQIQRKEFQKQISCVTNNNKDSRVQRLKSKSSRPGSSQILPPKPAEQSNRKILDKNKEKNTFYQAQNSNKQNYVQLNKKSAESERHITASNDGASIDRQSLSTPRDRLLKTQPNQEQYELNAGQQFQSRISESLNRGECSMKKKIDAKWVQSVGNEQKCESNRSASKEMSSKRSVSKRRRIPRALITSWD